MDEMISPGSTALADVPTHRPCTRCDGQQALVDSRSGFGKFRCDHCALTVGFDLESDPAEFMIDRGAPGRYSKEIFGSRLIPSELRLP
ncbi:MAG: hypothetical protein JJT89_11990 [Nitriliruptoraceae bacterium]|nr:hypothetical protein [Nitriliruptoraceae bacterium]